MRYQLNFPLPPSWTCEEDSYEEVDGALITHLECLLPRPGKDTNEAQIDVYVGDMPSDTTAEDEAYANYAEIIGWDEEDDDESPIAEWRFQGKKAFGFSGECEDGSIMLLMCMEITRGGLLILSVVAPNDDEVSKWAKYVEENLKVKAFKE